MTIITNSLYRSVYFIIHQQLSLNLPKSSLIQVLLPIICGNLSSLVSYPFDTIRRHQIVSGNGILSTIQNIYIHTGLTGYYYGLLWHFSWRSCVSLLRISFFYLSMKDEDRLQRKKKYKR